MRAKKFSKRMLALLLSAVMVAEPASGSMIVHATEAGGALTALETESEEIKNAEVDKNAENSDSEEDENKKGNTDEQGNGKSDSDSQENEGNASEDQNNTGAPSDDQKGEEDGNGSDQLGAENQNPDEKNPDEEDPDEESPDEQAPDEEKDGEVEDAEDDETALDEEKEAEDQNSAGILSMPSDYKLTSEQKNMKSALSASMGDFDDSAEGVEYVKKQVFAFADSREEAETIAEAYRAELIEYDEGVAVLKLKEDASVGATLRVAASSDNNLPAVYPDYYRHIHVEEGQQEDQAVEITEEEYELEAGAFDVSESEEPSLASYEQAVETLGEPNMLYDSEYYQWQHVNVGSVYAWDADYKGQGVTVAVLDSGVSGNTDIVPKENIN